MAEEALLLARQALSEAREANENTAPLAQDFTKADTVKMIQGDDQTYANGTGISSGEFHLDAGWYLLATRLASPPSSSVTLRYYAQFSKVMDGARVALSHQVKYYEPNTLGIDESRMMYLESGKYEMQILVQLGPGKIGSSAAAMRLYKFVRDDSGG